MASTLHKSLDVLETVLNMKGRPVTPTHVSSTLGIPPATCVRILKEFTARGYIHQKSRREGYTAGPAVFCFEDAGFCCYSEIVKTSEKHVQEIAVKLGRLVLVSTYQSGRKYILRHYKGSGHTQYPLQNSYNDLYDTISGRMLLAHLPENELLNYVSQNGLPGDSWKQVSSREDLKKELSTIKEMDCLCLFLNNEYWGISVPIMVKGAPVCTISSSVLREEEAKNASALLKDAACQICGSLTKENVTAV